MIVLASAEKLRMSYNARMSCINMGIYILNSSKSLIVFLWLCFFCLFVGLFCWVLGEGFFGFVLWGFICLFVRFLFGLLGWLFFFSLGRFSSDPTSIPKKEEEKTNVPITHVPLLISIPIYPESSVLEIIRPCEQR